MIFFFHHYELPAILRRGNHIPADDQIIAGQLELEILNPPVQNVADDVENADNTDVNIIANDNENNVENNAAQNSSNLESLELRSNSHQTAPSEETSLRQRVHLSSDGEMRNNSQSDNSPLNNLDNTR